MNEMELVKEVSAQEEIITRYLERWADEKENKLFIYYGEEDRSITYHQFNGWANSIGHSLRARGINKGDRVCVFLKNPLVTTLTMFGIWKCGAVFCPINYNYNGKLLSYQLNDTQPTLLITERSLVPVLNEIAKEIAELDTAVYNPLEEDHDYQTETAGVHLYPGYNEFSFHELLVGAQSNLNIEINYWDPANIIYTSGTTGPAKGVVQSHRWMNGYTYLARVIMSEDDVVYNDLPLYHVGGAFYNVAMAAFVGCSVGLWDKFSPNQFWNRINECKATTAILLDVMIPWLMNAEPTPNDRFNTLNKVYMQPLPLYHHEVAKRFGIDFIKAGMGQTESGCIITGLVQELGEDEGTPAHLYKGLPRQEILARAERHHTAIIDGKKDLKKGFMGIPAFYYEVAILNENDEELPAGQVGQIALRSRLPHFILKEYINRPESTLKSFSNLWYHTGDAGYKEQDGYYYFVDRLGGVIRCRGEKISSYQLEDIMNGHPDIDLCAAFPVPAAEGDEDDVAVYIIAKTGKTLNENELREWIKVKMPKFMWPKHIRFTHDMPRTPTNKIEKYKLQKELMTELKQQESAGR